jgi:hypothetical protein
MFGNMVLRRIFEFARGEVFVVMKKIIKCTSWLMPLTYHYKVIKFRRLR